MTIRLQQTQLVIELLAQADGKPPKEFRLFKSGLQETSKGIFKFSEKSCTTVLEGAKKYGNDYAIDYGHAMHSWISLDPAESGKAAGWFSLEIRSGEAWAVMKRWTPKATKMLEDGEYRYFSPVFDHTEEGEIVSLVSVGLTNIPATYEMTPLMASQLAAAQAALSNTTPHQPSEPPAMKFLLAKLGLSDTATEVEAVAKLEQLLAAPAQFQSQIAQLTGKTGPEALGTIQAWKAGFDTVATLSQENTSLKAAQLSQEVTALLDQGKRDGKIPPALEPVLKTMELSQLKAFLAVAPKAVVKGEVIEGTAGRHATLTQEEMLVAAQMGMSPEAVEKAKAARNAIKP